MSDQESTLNDDEILNEGGEDLAPVGDDADGDDTDTTDGDADDADADDSDSDSDDA